MKNFEIKILKKKIKLPLNKICSCWVVDFFCLIINSKIKIILYFISKTSSVVSQWESNLVGWIKHNQCKPIKTCMQLLLINKNNKPASSLKDNTQLNCFCPFVRVSTNIRQISTCLNKKIRIHFWLNFILNKYSFIYIIL